MSGEALKEETPAPVTAAMDGRGSSGVNAQRSVMLYRSARASANSKKQSQSHEFEQHRSNLRNNLKGLWYEW
jgi:hypothetical protein